MYLTTLFAKGDSAWQGSARDAWEASFLWAIQAHRAARHRSRISVVTFGQTQPMASAAAQHISPSAAMATAVARALFMEDRPVCGPMIDIWPLHQLPNAASLQAALEQQPAEYALAFHHGLTYAQRLVTAPEPAARAGTAPHPDMTTVITGGTKGLGLEYAREAATRGAGCLVLASRNPRLPREELEHLACCGTACFVVERNAADPAASAELAEWAYNRLPAVQTYAHAAGALGHDLIKDMTPQAMKRVTAPKVATIATFNDATMPVQSAALFSSTSAVWSQTGAAHYSAANAALDAHAGAARYAGKPAFTVNFGPFGEVGMAAAHASEMSTVGLSSLPPRTAVEAFNDAGYAPRTVRARISVLRFTKVNTVKGPWPFLDRLASSSADSAPASDPFAAAFAAPQARGTAVAARRTPPRAAISLVEVTALVQSAAETTLGEAVPLDGAFAPGAFDSLSAVELANAVSKAVGRDLPSTLVFDYPSVAAMAAHVASLVTPAAELLTSAIASKQLPGQVGQALSARDPHYCSAVGLEIAGRCPLVSEPSMFSRASTHSGDVIATLPYERWDIDALKDGRPTLRVRFGGVVAGLDRFDAAAFGVTPPEAQLMDPQQRLLMEVRIATYTRVAAHCNRIGAACSN